MEEKFIMMDILITEKNITANTITALNEASCDEVYNLYFELFNDLTKSVKELFTICYNNNWYQLEAAPKIKVEQEISKLCGELNQEEA